MHKHFNKFTVEWKKIELKEKSCEKWLTTNTFTLQAEIAILFVTDVDYHWISRKFDISTAVITIGVKNILIYSDTTVAK